MILIKYMALNFDEQIVELINKSNNILITFPKDYTVDSIASALVMSIFLEKLNKKHDIVCATNDFESNVKFLKGIEKIKTTFESLNKFIVKLDLSNSNVREFSYDIKDGFLNIYITPEKGSFSTRDVKTQSSDFKYDLIIVLDSRDLASLGRVFEEQSEFFYKVPIINIDNSAQNENFGQVNLVDLTSCSVSEMLYKLLKNIDEEIFDKVICTSILSGIISKTKSFKSEVVTPQCLSIAGELVSKGANKDEIIKNLYQRKTVSILKVWGKLLSSLEHDESKKIFYSSIAKEDINGLRINASDIISIIDDLLVTIPEAEIVLLSYYIGDDTVRHILWANKNYDADTLSKPFSPSGTSDLVSINLKGDDLKEQQGRIIKEIQSRIG